MGGFLDPLSQDCNQAVKTRFASVSLDCRDSIKVYLLAAVVMLLKYLTFATLSVNLLNNKCHK